VNYQIIQNYFVVNNYLFWGIPKHSSLSPFGTWHMACRNAS